MKNKFERREGAPESNKEMRFLLIKDLEVRQVNEEDEEGTDVEVGGYALKWNEKASIGGYFTESFKRGAFAETIVDDDQLMMVQHDSLPIARRSAETMSLSEDRTGLAFKATLDTADPDSNSVVRKIRRGDVKGVSVGFTMEGGRQVWDFGEGEDLDHRTIEKVGQLLEISVVGQPAYSDSEIGLRSLEEARKEAGIAKEGNEPEPEENGEEQTVEANEGGETRDQDADSEGELETLTQGIAERATRLRKARMGQSQATSNPSTEETQHA